MTEFNLSESREIVKQILKGVYTGTTNHRIIDLIFGNIENQDKEFIRLLKEEVGDNACVCNECNWCLRRLFIDKLAGDKLK